MSNKKPQTPAPLAAPVAPALLTMAAVGAMTQAARIDSFKAHDQVLNRADVNLIKLLVGIRAAMQDPSQATGLLKKNGIRPGTVNTASEGARVFTALVPDHLSEPAFDDLTQADRRAINRVMSGASKKKLDAAGVAKLLADHPKDFDDQLESIFTTGMTIAEADAEAARIAEEEKQKAAPAAPAAEQPKAATTPPAPAPATATKTTTATPAPTAQASDPATPPQSDPATVSATPAAETPAPAPVATSEAAPTAPAPAPTNVEPMPQPVNHDAVLAECEAAVDTIIASSADLPPEHQKRLFAKLNEALGIVGDRIPQVALAA